MSCVWAARACDHGRLVFGARSQCAEGVRRQGVRAFRLSTVMESSALMLRPKGREVVVVVDVVDDVDDAVVDDAVVVATRVQVETAVLLWAGKRVSDF
jgi:hypothetical protein